MKNKINIAVFSTLNLGSSFLFQLILISYMGPGNQTDAFIASMTIPQFMLTLISGSLTNVLVPLLSGNENHQARMNIWTFVFIMGTLFGFLAIILFTTASWWVPYTVPGFDNAGQALATRLTQVQLLGMVLTAINGVQMAAYYAQRRFVWPELSQFISISISLVFLYVMLPLYGVIAAAWIGFIRIAMQTLLLSPVLGRPTLPNLRESNIRTAWTRIKPMLIGSAYFKTEPFVDRFLLSSTTSGSLSLYYLAQQIYSAATQVLGKAIVNPLIPALSSAHKLHKRDEFKQLFNRNLLALCVLCAGFLVVFGLFGKWLLSLLMGHGSVTQNNVLELWWIMIFLAGMFFSGALGQLVSGSFYAIGNTRTPVVVSAITYTIYIPAKIFVFRTYSLDGLALLVSVYYLVDLALLFVLKRVQA